MSKVRVAAYSISLDGYGAGTNQSLEQPLGKGGESLHEWIFPTKTFQTNVMGNTGGKEGIDNDFAKKSFDNIGAWILGRNMFSPDRGSWQDNNWKGWWGDNPPYHVPVFILTNHEREPIQMKGGTTFYFITSGYQSALDLAIDAAKGKDVRIGGGAYTIRLYLRAGLIDEMHLAMSPVLLGSGESLFEEINLPQLGYQVSDAIQGERAQHVLISKVNT